MLRLMSPPQQTSQIHKILVPRAIRYVIHPNSRHPGTGYPSHGHPIIRAYSRPQDYRHPDAGPADSRYVDRRQPDPSRVPGSQISEIKDSRNPRSRFSVEA